MSVITKDTTIGPASQGETVEEAAMVHGVDADQLVAKMNAVPDEA